MKVWLDKLGTLVSQATNALLLGGSPDQSVSSRLHVNQYLTGWATAHAWVEALFGTGHCEQAFLSDVRFAEGILDDVQEARR